MDICLLHVKIVICPQGYLLHPHFTHTLPTLSSSTTRSTAAIWSKKNNKHIHFIFLTQIFRLLGQHLAFLRVCPCMYVGHYHAYACGEDSFSLYFLFLVGSWTRLRLVGGLDAPLDETEGLISPPILGSPGLDFIEMAIAKRAISIHGGVIGGAKPPLSTTAT